MSTPKEKKEDILDLTLRPRSWEEYVGQEKLKENLKIIITAAKQRKEIPEHLLFYGGSGLGKTSLAHLVAKEIGSEIKVTSGPAIERAGDLAAILTNLPEGAVLFLDECLEGDTLIALADGTFKRIKDIKNKDRVVGGTVSSFFKKNVSTTIKIKTSFNSIECSKTHPCIVARNGEIKTVSAKDIKKSDYLLIPIQLPHITKNNLSIAQAKFLALILCDGHINKEGRTIQVETRKDYPFFKKIFEEGIKSFDLSKSPKNKIGTPRKTNLKYTLKITKRDSQLLRIYSTNLVEELISIGIPLGNKHDIIEVPTIIFNAPLESIKAFIDVCFCCEGWVINSKEGRDVRLMLDMNSKSFIQQLQLLLKKFGIHGSHYIRKRKKDMHRLSISGKNLELFYKKIGLSLPRKSDALHQICTSSHLLKPDLIPLPKFWINNEYSNYTKITRPNLENLLELNLNLQDRLNYHYEKIKDIQRIKKKKTVYDFTTTEHTFIANGILTHNCHRLSRVIEEYLYPAMEEFKLNLILGKGPMARTMELKIPRFTLIGATTRLASLSAPLRSRFGAIFGLNFYQVSDIEKILQRSAQILNVEMDKEPLKIIAKSSRFTPRVANHLLKRVRDFAQVKGEGKITEKITIEALKSLEIDELGLIRNDRRILEAIIRKFNGGPVGLQALAAATAEEEDTILDIYEPYLMRLCFIERTSRGRIATKLAYQHLGMKFRNPQNHLL